MVTFGHRSYAELTTGFGGCSAATSVRLFLARVNAAGTQSNEPVRRRPRGYILAQKCQIGVYRKNRTRK